MFNLIKMNLYRMTHAVSTWVLGIVAMAIAFLDFGLMKILIDDPFKMGISDGKTTITALKTIGSFLMGTDLLIILAIFVVIFANAEHKSGFDKNIIGITKMKWKHTLARWASAMIGVTVMMVLAYGVYFGMSALFMNHFELGNMAQYAKVLGVVYVCYAAFSAIFFFFTTAFQSSVGGIIPSLVITTGIFTLLEQLADLGIKKLIHNPKFLPSDVLFDGVFRSLEMDAGAKSLLRVVAVAAVYIVVLLGACMFMQQRRDVK